MTERPRVVVLTDISSIVGGFGEPDDAQSFIRLLLYSNELDIEGLIATYTKHGHAVFPEYLHILLQIYDKVHNNLLKHDQRYPSQEKLAKLIKCGNQNDGPKFIGEGNDTEGSNWIIECANRLDERPLWIIVWGGTTDLAQALWRVKETKGGAFYQKFKSKLRVYAIGDQYEMNSMVRDENPDLFYIVSSDSFRGMYKEGNQNLVNNSWLHEHLRFNHGPLGAAYPQYDGEDPWGEVHGLKEGDSPSLLYLIQNGLSDPEYPEWGAWGGRFVKKRGECYEDAEEEFEGVKSVRSPIFRWRQAFQNDFQARMDWCIKSYQESNHAPVVKVKMIENQNPKPGDTIELDASESFDPDGDSLSFHWQLHREASSYSNQLVILGEHSANARLLIPEKSEGDTLHIILSVMDDGAPPLTSYKRLIFTVK
ncbi:DUF1593 domain-containing protein [Alkalihalobacillus trypoxylicola]|uniref:DUF1593 domain-containing protein n=1 Tax=Alkalihalobacillus trypoxylicola TaxID=519424 RepID=A0A161PG72_9BACI|nr:DUF1593 domain-containing protein [Alkalihalobacillus trypoxylicola]KYG27702.1 hypothetical protein AZF04_10965 [Alkalihalobacillus trypoxylicola]